MGKIQIPIIKVDDVEADQKPTELISSDGSVPPDAEDYGVNPESSKMELPDMEADQKPPELSCISYGSVPPDVEALRVCRPTTQSLESPRPNMGVHLPHRLPSRSSETVRPNMEADQKPTGSTNSSDGSVPYDERSLSLVSNDSNDGASWPDMEDYGVNLTRSKTPPPNMKADKKPTGLIGRIIRVLQAKVSALKKKTAPVEALRVCRPTTQSLESPRPNMRNNSMSSGMRKI